MQEVTLVASAPDVVWAPIRCLFLVNQLVARTRKLKHSTWQVTKVSDGAMEKRNKSTHVNENIKTIVRIQRTFFLDTSSFSFCANAKRIWEALDCSFFIMCWIHANDGWSPKNWVNAGWSCLNRWKMVACLFWRMCQLIAYCAKF